MCKQPEFQRPQLSPDFPVKPPELDFYMPATPPLAFLEKVAFWLRIFRRRHHFRRLFVPLLREEDRILSDTGFNRSDIEWALALPLKVDALKALEACRRAREESERLLEGHQACVGDTVARSSCIRPGIRERILMKS